MSREHPFANQAGEIVGDVATIVTGRLPLARGVGAAEKALKGIRRADLAPGWQNVADKAFKSSSMKSLYRGMGRAAEAGFEGAVLSMLKEGNPLEAGAYSAGAQMAGSGVLSVASDLFTTKGVLRSLTTTQKLALGAATATALTGLLQQVTPLGEGNSYDAIRAMDTGYAKVAAGLGLGILATGAGFGRVRSENLPKLVDAVTAAPRAGVISLLTDLAKEKESGGDAVSRTAAHLAKNPDIFNDSQQKALNSAFEGGTFAKTVDKLLRTDPRFAKTIAADAVETAEESAEDLRKSIRERLRQ
jgi:hypothetical protein